MIILSIIYLMLLTPIDASPLHWEADQNFKQEKYQDAIPKYVDVLEDDKGKLCFAHKFKLGVHQNLALSYYYNQEPYRAYQVIQQGLQIDPFHKELTAFAGKLQEELSLPSHELLKTRILNDEQASLLIYALLFIAAIATWYLCKLNSKIHIYLMTYALILVLIMVFYFQKSKKIICTLEQSNYFMRPDESLKFSGSLDPGMCFIVKSRTRTWYKVLYKGEAIWFKLTSKP